MTRFNLKSLIGSIWFLTEKHSGHKIPWAQFGGASIRRPSGRFHKRGWRVTKKVASSSLGKWRDERGCDSGLLSGDISPILVSRLSGVGRPGSGWHTTPLSCHSMKMHTVRFYNWYECGCDREIILEFDFGPHKSPLHKKLI